MANALNYQIVSNTTTCKSLLLHICNCNFNNILFTKLPWPGDSEETFRPSNQAAILNSIIYSISIVVDKLQRLNQWFPTAGPPVRLNSLPVFFPYIIAMFLLIIKLILCLASFQSIKLALLRLLVIIHRRYQHI